MENKTQEENQLNSLAEAAKVIAKCGMTVNEMNAAIEKFNQSLYRVQNAARIRAAFIAMKRKRIKEICLIIGTIIGATIYFLFGAAFILALTSGMGG